MIEKAHSLVLLVINEVYTTTPTINKANPINKPIRHFFDIDTFIISFVCAKCFVDLVEIFEQHFEKTNTVLVKLSEN